VLIHPPASERVNEHSICIAILYSRDWYLVTGRLIPGD
jgi:hypothetical protein